MIKLLLDNITYYKLDLVLILMVHLFYFFAARIPITNFIVNNEQDWYKYMYPFRKTSTITSANLRNCLLSTVMITYGFIYMLARKCKKEFIIHSSVIYFITAAKTFVMVRLITIILKRIIGEFRPDYLNRCFSNFWDSSANPPVSYSIISKATKCSSKYSERVIKDGRQSFPSGHASYSAAVCSVVVYMLYQTYVKIYDKLDDHMVPSAEIANNFESNKSSLLGKNEMTKRNIKGSILIYCYIIGLILPLAISATRVIDHRHSTFDVISGLALGYCTGYIINIPFVTNLSFTVNKKSLIY